jgi:GSH-dependent disulfide-bond oxidoreductase
MLTFYHSPAPNPMKVALFLEETGTPYQPVRIDTRRGAQHDPGFKALNPNAKVPVIVDGETVVFDSNAILLYLAEKTGRFLPADPARRGELLSWLMFIASGLGPYNGQAVHFQHHADDKNAYAINRYTFEAERHFGILDDRLETRPHILGDDYTIVDMAAWGWSNPLELILGEGAWARFPNLQRWHAAISARPAATRAKELSAGPVTPMDEEARRHMFPQNARLAG